MKLDDIKKLTQKKYREEFGFFLLEGEHLVLELQKAVQHNIALAGSELYVCGDYETWHSPFKTHVISARQMAQISDTKTPQGIVAVVPLAAITQTTEQLPPLGKGGPASRRVGVQNHSTSAKNTRAIYLHEIQDPGNLGTILRTLAWFGGFRCLLSAGCVDPFNPKVVRASMGAIFHVPLELDVELASLQERFARIAGLDMQGERVQSESFKHFDCYLFGNEARGVPREQLATLEAKPFTISGCGAIESLNLASAVAICAFELSR